MNAPKIGQDISFILISIVLAFFIVESGVVHKIIDFLPKDLYLGVFFSGMLFTSIFTTAPSIAILGELSQEGNVLLVALIGSMGAVFGDYILLRFFKDRFSEDVKDLFSRNSQRKFHTILNKKIFRFLTPLLGAMIIASPFPDEFGIALLGLSRLRTIYFVLISFIFNFIGIYIIGIVANLAT